MNDFAKLATPSFRSSAQVRSTETPCASIAASWRFASARPSLIVTATTPWSLNAESVAGGSVLTVCGPISAST